jgi:hypothetical protein
MLPLIINILWFLVVLCLLMGVVWLVVWVLGQIGIPVPPMALKIALLIVALLCLIYFLTMLAGGGMGFPHLGAR